MEISEEKDFSSSIGYRQAVDIPACIRSPRNNYIQIKPNCPAQQFLFVQPEITGLKESKTETMKAYFSKGRGLKCRKALTVPEF